MGTSCCSTRVEVTMTGGVLGAGASADSALCATPQKAAATAARATAAAAYPARRRDNASAMIFALVFLNTVGVQWALPAEAALPADAAALADLAVPVDAAVVAGAGRAPGVPRGSASDAAIGASSCAAFHPPP